MEHPTLRVATWNLWWRFGDWQQRLTAIRSVLAELRPDVCGFQEVWAGPDGNQAELLASEFGMYGAYSPSPAPGRWQRRLGDNSIGFGNAVISRWPIRETHIAHLAGGAVDEGRTVLHAAIDAPAGRMDVFTTHLNSGPHESAVRFTQVGEVARFVAAHANGAYPPVLTGDLNAEPDSDELRRLGGHLTAGAVGGQVLIDCWRYADLPIDGWTWDRRNPHVAAGFGPSARIDYIMVGLPGADGRGHVERVAVFGDDAVAGVWPSDHAGVVTDLRA
jgi:endonuclease/exonuclease/phosphatase family metal-dependent hydrolase